MTIRYVFDFSEGDKDRKDLLGGKGANLAEMVKLGLPVPPGFTISTEACRAYLQAGTVPDGLDGEVADHLAALKAVRGKKLGDRRSAAVSLRSLVVLDALGMREPSQRRLERRVGARVAAQSENPVAWTLTAGLSNFEDGASNRGAVRARAGRGQVAQGRDR